MMHFLGKHKQKIGICISSQQALKQQDRFALWLDQVVTRHGCGIVFIPMNPITDFALMSEIREEMINKDQSIIATGTDNPEHVAGLAQHMDIVISSRLHLLIFASVSATPCVGIGRGSKVSVFLKQMGQQTAGSTENIDFDKLDASINDIFLRPQTYHDAAVIARADMLERLEKATDTLGNVIRKLPGKSITQSPKLVLEAQQ
jgi:polysaccharide pyruvyl transferase WcaK-like protein